jgi:hypothetical protein
MRTYLAVERHPTGREERRESGATIAYPEARPGSQGIFAIVIQSDVEHGLWQR